MHLSTWLFRILADNRKRTSLASRYRQKRFELFRSLISNLDPPVTILDIGGTADYWNSMGISSSDDYKITLLNIHQPASMENKFRWIMGDARHMDFASRSFDLVFSNSVIEHVGGFADQKRMADEVRRVGERFMIQTPNRYFPMEPHYVFPMFQFLPMSIKVYLLIKFRLGWVEKGHDAQHAREIVESIRLLSKKELCEMFPGARIYKEKFFGMTKSFIVIGGWD